MERMKLEYFTMITVGRLKAHIIVDKRTRRLQAGGEISFNMHKSGALLFGSVSQTVDSICLTVPE